MNAYGVVDSALASTSAPDRVKWLASRFGRSTRVGRVSLESAYSGEEKHFYNCRDWATLSRPSSPHSVQNIERRRLVRSHTRIQNGGRE